MRQHIGFERLWSMQIPVPYSLFLRAGDFGWSCGQCPLDRAGQVVAPGDALAQTRLVAGYAQTLLAESGFAVTDLRLAVVYHDMPDPGPALAILRGALGPVLLMPVKVPAFYYPGMMIEVDLFAMADNAAPLRFVTGGPQVLTPETLLDHCIAPDPTGTPAHSVIDPALDSPHVWALIADKPVRQTTHHLHAADIRLRQSGPWHVFTATAPTLPGLVPQTEAIMSACAELMTRYGLGFADVVKSTTHYVGAATPDELHDNMAVRNRRYTAPGPASTGIRVSTLADPDARTAVTLLLHKP